MQEELPLPPGVREKHGSWHYVENHKWRKLCRVSEGRPQLYIRLRELTGGVAGTCWYAILSYVANGMRELAAATQANYRQASWRMLHHFGHERLEDVQPTHCAQFLEWCKENTSALTGNRDKAFMSSVYEYAMRRGWVCFNPWRGVRRNKERPSRKYVEHDALKAALDRAPPWLYGLLGTMYLTGMRETDAQHLKVANLLDGRIEWIESKTGKSNSSPISGAVAHCLNVALEHREAAARQHETMGRVEKAMTVRNQPFIFLSERGLPWSQWGLQSALRRFQAGFQARQLRPKAQTDKPEANILGHVGQMRELYTRKRRLDVVK